MINFQDYLQEVKDPTGKLKDACWKGYTAVGMKMKNGKKVPNCVPQNEEVEQIDEISAKLAGNYYGAATKKHIDKVGVKSNMYDRIEKDMGKNRKAGVDRALDRVMGSRKTNEEVEQIDEIAVIPIHKIKIGSHVTLHPTVRGGPEEKVKVVGKDHENVHVEYGDMLGGKRVKEVHHSFVKEEVEQIDEVSDKTLQSYRSKAHTQIQHYKYAGGKDKPEASAVLAKREPGMASATAKVVKKDKERIAAQPKREPQKASSYKPLGGRDEKSGRSYSEELSVEQQFDLIEELVMDLAEQHNIDPETLWEKFESIDDAELYEAAVDAKGHKSSTGGLTQKGRDAYNRQSGGNLKAPVTTPPSKLKAGSKAANRRKSFCARMGGMEGAMKKPNGEPTRKALALRKWNC
jgi:hypothetical protein